MNPLIFSTDAKSLWVCCSRRFGRNYAFFSRMNIVIGSIFSSFPLGLAKRAQK